MYQSLQIIYLNINRVLLFIYQHHSKKFSTLETMKYQLLQVSTLWDLRFRIKAMEYWFAKYCKKKLSRNNNQVLLFNKQHNYKYNLSFIFLNSVYVYSYWYFMKERWKWRSAFSITDNAYCLHPVTVLKLTECIQKQTCDKIVLN